MKRLIVGILLIQALIVACWGIPAGGAAAAVWRDAESGYVVRQSNPEQSLRSFYDLVARNSYTGAVQLFAQEDQANINSDLLAAYFQESGLAQAQMVGIYAAPAVGPVDVAASIQLLDNGSGTAQPMLAFHTLRKTSGRWELVQQVSQTDVGEIKLVLERAIKLCDIILKDPMPTLTDEQKDQLYQQLSSGREMMSANLEQINALPQP